MWTHLRVGLALVVLAGPVGAETAPVSAGCGDLKAMLAAATGLDLTAPPAATSDGWCVLDGARHSGGDVRVSAEALRVRGEMQGDRLVALEVEAEGLRVVPTLNNGDIPGWLRDLLRLQAADVRVSLRRDEEADLVRVERGQVWLSGGTNLSLMATVAGADLNPTTLPAGRVTELHLQFGNRGRLFNPIMEVMGESLRPNASGRKEEDFARNFLLGVVGALRSGAVSDETARELGQFVRSLPAARGQLVVDFSSDKGIGAADVALLVLSDAPFGSKSLSRFLSGSELVADRTPGLDP